MQLITPNCIIKQTTNSRKMKQYQNISILWSLPTAHSLCEQRFAGLDNRATDRGMLYNNKYRKE